jgi:GGDEF domain-containing protein
MTLEQRGGAGSNRPFIENIEPFLAEHQALFDSATGLPGPVLVLDRLEVALARSRRLQCFVGVLVLVDVDARGPTQRPVPDLVTFLGADLRADDVVARIHPRTFVVICGELYRPEDADHIATRLLRHVGVKGRAGIALGRPSDDALELLVRASDEASGGNPAANPYPNGTPRRWTE